MINNINRNDNVNVVIKSVSALLQDIEYCLHNRITLVYLLNSTNKTIAAVISVKILNASTCITLSELPHNLYCRHIYVS